ncbi:hypothetical protein K501DRAFT_287080 [Backusella circina FSU 941]|nr:hypothetical protein K501DRAFT_287080 [Backusella circina FSU 941]
MNKIHWSPEYLNEYPVPHYVPSTKLDVEQPNAMYPVSPFYTPTVASSPSDSPLSSSSGVIYGSDAFVTSAYPLQQHPGSPDSLMSGMSAAAAPLYQISPPMVQSSSTSTITSAASSAAYLNETIAKASALPESFYPEFLQYSKESFEQNHQRRNNASTNSKKRNRQQDDDDDEKPQLSSSSSTSSEDEADERPARKQAKVESEDTTSMTELRRQIHIQSEQKRRAQIKDGFEDLRSELPACLNKKMSKVTLLHRTVQHIQHLKSTQMTILAELERLVQENEQLRSFQQGVLQKQALENMYTIGNM